MSDSGLKSQQCPHSSMMAAINKEEDRGKKKGWEEDDGVILSFLFARGETDGLLPRNEQGKEQEYSDPKCVIVHFLGREHVNSEHPGVRHSRGRDSMQEGKLVTEPGADWLPRIFAHACISAFSGPSPVTAYR